MRHLLACPATDGFGCRCEELRAARAAPGADNDARLCAEALALDAAYADAERFDRAQSDAASRRLAERFAGLVEGSPEWLALDAECAAAEAEAEAWGDLDRYAGDRR